MFDIFNRKKIKELEGDIRTLYSLYESQQRHIKCSGIFDSFVSNTEEVHRIYTSIYHQGAYIEKEWEDITIKTVLEMVLKKMGLKISYKPGRKKEVREIPSEFKLIKKE